MTELSRRTEWKGFPVISIHLKATSRKRSGLEDDGNWF